MAARSPIFLVLVCASMTITAVAGLRLELTHVDAQANCTAAERLRRATESAHRRLASMGGVTAPVHLGDAHYVAEFGIGEPPQRAQAVIGINTNLIWTQCVTCAPDCFAQTLPYYNFSLSSTDRAVPCSAALCTGAGREARCAADGAACAVRGRYGIGAFAGALGTEMFTFASEKATLAFGCVTATDIKAGSLDGASGVIGLGRGPLSLPSQLGDTKFSYCFAPYPTDDAAVMNSSHLFVGPAARLSGNAAVTTVPFAENPKEEPFSSYYYLPLVGMTVGGVKLDIPAAAFATRQVATGVWAGGAVIDSSAPFTWLVDAAYTVLREELARRLAGSLVSPPAGSSVELCVARGDAGSLLLPLVLHFGGGGGDLAIPPTSYWGPVDDARTCMVVFNAAAIARTPMNETTVIGNYMQQDVHVLYDIGKGVLSFQPADCSSI